MTHDRLGDVESSSLAISAPPVPVRALPDEDEEPWGDEDEEEDDEDEDDEEEEPEWLVGVTGPRSPRRASPGLRLF
jgi:hypothetical protein